MCSFQTPPVGRGDARGVIAGIHKTHSMLYLIACSLYFGSRHSDQASSNAAIGAINGAGRNLVARMARKPPIIRLATCSAFRFLTSHYSFVGAGGCCLFGMTGPLQIIWLATCAAFRPLLRRGDARGVIRYPTPAGSRHSDQASSNAAIGAINGAGRNLVARMARMPLIIRLATCSAFRFLTSHYSVVGAGGCCLFGMTGPLHVQLSDPSRWSG